MQLAKTVWHMNNISPNYHQHEQMYQELRKKGFRGWGGEALKKRMIGWNLTADNLINSPFFPPTGSTLLEIGSGAGDSLVPFAQAGYKVTGLEISETAVTWAIEKFAEKKLTANFIKSSVAEVFPFDKNSFDAILDASCLHCIVGADRSRTLQEIRRVIRPRGFFLVNHMVNDPRQIPYEIEYSRTERVLEKNGVPYRFIPELDELCTEVTQAGFLIINLEVRANSWWDHAEIWCLAE